MNKKTIVALIALVLVVALMVGIYFITRPGSKDEDTQKETNTQTDDGSSAPAGDTFTLKVVHADGTEKEFTITTEEEFLAPALIDEGIITEEGLETGMYNTVDGETADWNANQSYWAFYLGEEYASVGMNDAPIEEGAVYKLVYTIG